MIPITLGTDQETENRISLAPDLFRTHFHLLGATGSGKTNAILVMLRAILATPRPKAAMFLVDPMGNLSQDILRWIASERFCPQHVRDRLVYIKPAETDFVLPFNPLLHQTQEHLYYQVGRAMEVVLRAWASQAVEEMPRLRHWTSASFFAAAAMGFPIAACRYLLRPGTDEHRAMLNRLPDELRFMWSEVLSARGSEAIRLLESTRNRLAPFFDADILRRMFSCVENRFDVARFIRERKIVILNVASYGMLDLHIGQTIGGLAVNEIIRTAMNMTPAEVNPTYVLLDEFQKWVSPDLYDALPTVRQLGLRLILAHQSFAQLIRGDIDLSGLIWQARSRLMFANDADDADRIAHELATLTFDPMEIKDILYTRRQRVAAHRREWLTGTSSTQSTSRTEGHQTAMTTTRTSSDSRDPQGLPAGNSSGRTQADTHADSGSYSDGSAESTSLRETLVPIHEDFWEVSKKTFRQFEENRTVWAQRVRKRRTGATFGKFRDDDHLYDILVDHHPIVETAKLRAKLDELLQKNFESGLFLSKDEVEREAERIREMILREPPIVINARRSDRQVSGQDAAAPVDPDRSSDHDNLFA